VERIPGIHGEETSIRWVCSELQTIARERVCSTSEDDVQVDDAGTQAEVAGRSGGHACYSDYTGTDWIETSADERVVVVGKVVVVVTSI
jgi:hypothetical protein